MPVSNEDRALYAKLNDAERAAAAQTHLKAIREGSTGPGVMDHVAINNALDHIAVLTEKQPANPSPKPSDTVSYQSGRPAVDPNDRPFVSSPPVQPNPVPGHTPGVND